MRNLNENSLAAFTALEPKLTKREQWVLEALEQICPASCEEVAKYLMVPVNVISGRFTGLRNKGKIEEAYKQRNSRGSRVSYWQPVKELKQVGLL